nr:tetratricopeptide repeat protein [Bacillus gaemokensis]
MLNTWYHEMLSQHLEKATSLKQEMDKKINEFTSNKELSTYYSLLNFRFQMLCGDFEKDLEDLSYLLEEPDNYLKYYYHFFQFIHASELGQYTRAEHHYGLAEGLLSLMQNKEEQAEFHYRAALYHYYLAQPTLAINHVNKAIEFFSTANGYKTKLGACQNTLGMAYITLEQYDMAEEYLLSALNILEQEKESKAALTVRYNLGVFYAEQDLSELAIRHLTDAFEQFSQPRVPYQKKGIHTLAKEHFKLGNLKEANFYVQEGLKDCTKEYEYRFTILKAMIENEPIEKLEKIILDAISYFKEQDLWKEILNYSELLAVKWFDKGTKDKACDYYRMNHEARILLKEKRYLK